MGYRDREKDELLHRKRHSLAHALGAALIEMYPGTKLAIGPVVEDGFYYDAEIPTSISVDVLPDIEKKMREILKQWTTFEKKVVSKEEALDYFKENPYKKDLIEQTLRKGEGTTTLHFW